MTRKWNYYNDNDPFVCEWVRNLIHAKLVPCGEVDERSISEVQPEDVRGFKQCHWFCGILGWSLALELAGWPEDYPVWTGSCPCQDFSNAGRKAGFEGERDMWPAWFRLIRECRPDTVFGEQVDDSPEWYDRTADDLESVGYTVGACVVPACAVGAPHERARLWFVANCSIGQAWRQKSSNRMQFIESPWSNSVSQTGGCCCDIHRATRHCPPDVRLVANGVSENVDAIESIGNAIVPQVAAEFITAYMECRP